MEIDLNKEYSIQDIENFIKELDNETIGKAIKLLINYDFSTSENMAIDLLVGVLSVITVCKEHNKDIKTITQKEYESLEW